MRHGPRSILTLKIALRSNAEHLVVNFPDRVSSKRDVMPSFQ